MAWGHNHFRVAEAPDNLNVPASGRAVNAIRSFVGAIPDDAFSVHVGLGDTMTPEDILDGILRVTILVALSRPAEFIEITFEQKMQKS